MPRRGVGNPDVVEHDVEPPEPVDRRGDEGRHLLLERDVAPKGDGDPAGFLDLFGRLGGAVGIDVGADDRGALLAEPERGRTAYPGAGAGDGSDLFLEHHFGADPGMAAGVNR